MTNGARKMEETLKLELGSKAVIAASGERGEVIGVAVYAVAETSYLLRYKAADGRAVEAWWNASALARFHTE
jgi:hypothetical protein